MAYEPLDAPTDAVSAEVARDFAARYLEALNAHDVERVVSLTTEDVFWEDPYVRGGSFRGHNELRAFFAYLWRAFPDLEVRLVDDVYLRLVAEDLTLVDTLAAYLERTGSLEGAARELFVHPNTVRYRLRRIADITGLTATIPRDAWSLRLALTLGRLADDSPPL